MAGFSRAIASALAGHPQPLSWARLLGGSAAELGGPYKFVLVQPVVDTTALQPGGAAIDAIRAAAAKLEFVKSGDARVRITGNVALADEEFASVAQGTVVGLAGSIVLISLWLFLAVRSWRLIVPILSTLVLGLMLTLLFAAAAVGTLNLVSVGFGILFVGIAVDFAIQFCVRYREIRLEFPDPATALNETGRRVGGQILVAAAATSAGFPRLCTDRLSRCCRAGSNCRRRHADRVCLYDNVSAGAYQCVPSARGAGRNRVSLGGTAR